MNAGKRPAVSPRMSGAPRLRGLAPRLAPMTCERAMDRAVGYAPEPVATDKEQELPFFEPFAAAQTFLRCLRMNWVAQSIPTLPSGSCAAWSTSIVRAQGLPAPGLDS
jgi:hypothetical protein